MNDPVICFFQHPLVLIPKRKCLVGTGRILEVGVTSHVQICHIVLECLASFSLFIMFNLCACNVCENRRTITKISESAKRSWGNIIFKFWNLTMTGLFDSAIWKVSNLHWIQI